MSAQRQRNERLQMHVECALIKPSCPGLPDIPFAEIARELRIIIADDLTDDEIIMAAHRVRADYRKRSDPYARHHRDVVEANCARWDGRL
jgi:hypothetical protein